MITRQKVVAVLRKAGFTSAKFYTTSVAGYYHVDPGYRVHNYRGTISVEHCFSHTAREHNSQPHLEKYAAALTAAGIPNAIEKHRVVILWEASA